MGYFETYPWLLVLIVIVTIEAWSAIKTGIKALLRRRQFKRLNKG